MQAACQHCGAKYTLDDAKVAQHAKVQFKCAKCGQTTVIDTKAPAPASSDAPRATETTQAVSPLPSFARSSGGGTSGTIISQYQGLSLPADKNITISVIAGPSKGVVHQVTKPRVVIGRAGADLELNDPEVSRSHCSIEIKGDVVRLRDLDSTNGIYLDEERVRAAELQHLSEFRIGASSILIQITPKHE